MGRGTKVGQYGSGSDLILDMLRSPQNSSKENISDLKMSNGMWIVSIDIKKWDVHCIKHEVCQSILH